VVLEASFSKPVISPAGNIIMEESMSHTYLAPILIIIQLIFLEGILSIDNAAVLGAMVSILPHDKPAPYPKGFKLLQPFTDRYLGMQQTAALKVGLLGAYTGRSFMLLLAAFVSANPWLRLLGAFYLLKLAFENLGTHRHAEAEHAAEAPGAASTFWLVVLQVELADLAFSVDNVVAAVALSNELWVVLVGVALGILTMRFAAGIFTYLIRREPIFGPAAYLLVLAIGLELVLADLYSLHFDPLIKFLISISILALCVLYARVKFLHVLAPILHWLSQGMGWVNEWVNWTFKPGLVLLKYLFIFFRHLFTRGETASKQVPETASDLAGLGRRKLSKVFPTEKQEV
jgi:tellurite resistance protein TerC